MNLDQQIILQNTDFHLLRLGWDISVLDLHHNLSIIGNGSSVKCHPERFLYKLFHVALSNTKVFILSQYLCNKEDIRKAIKENSGP